MNDCGPWYETSEMTINECHTALFECLKFKYTDADLLKEAIIKSTPSNKNPGVGLGSYRGYYTFLHADYKKKVELWMEYRLGKPSPINKNTK